MPERSSRRQVWRQTREAKERFARARNASQRYGIQLREIARHIGRIVNGIFVRSNPAAWNDVQDVLGNYEMTIQPWAEATAARMLADVSQRDLRAWSQHGREIGQALRQVAETAPLGDQFRSLQDISVDLITSLPREAAQRVRELSEKSIFTGGRWEAIAGERWDEIYQGLADTSAVSQSRANTIARTEVARAQSIFSSLRAQHAGSEVFRWQTAGDADVRELHREISRGKGRVKGTPLGNGLYRWDDPPELDDGQPGLPGTVWNCRCWAEPLLEEVESPPPGRSPEYTASLRPEAEEINEAYRQGKLSHPQYLERLRGL